MVLRVARRRLGLQVTLDAGGPIHTPAGLFVPAEGHRVVEDHLAVQRDGAGLNPLGQPVRARCHWSHRGRQPVLGGCWPAPRPRRRRRRAEPATTGPKISCWYRRIPGSTSVSTVGWTKKPADRAWFPPVTTSTPSSALVDEAHDAVQLLLADEQADEGVIVLRPAELHRVGHGGHRLDHLVVDVAVAKIRDPQMQPCPE